MNTGMTKIHNVDNELRYNLVSNSWDLKINAEKLVLDNPGDPNRPLQAQVKDPEKSCRKRRP